MTYEFLPRPGLRRTLVLAHLDSQFAPPRPGVRDGGTAENPAEEAQTERGLTVPRNSTIGLILCSRKNEAIARYSALGEGRQIFAAES